MPPFFRLISVLWLVVLSYGQEPPTPTPPAPEPLPIVLEVTDKVALGEWISIRVETTGELHDLSVIQVRSGAGLEGIDKPMDEGQLFGPIDGEWRFTHREPGYYVIEAEAEVENKHHKARAVTLIGTPPPVPPGPGPGPGPTPPPLPPPVVSGLKVLILEEVDDRDTVPREQLTAMFDGAASKWLNANTAKESDGSVGWRRWDDDYSETEQDKMPPHWEIMYEQAIAGSNAVNDKLPWLYMTDGTRVHSQPFPGTAAQFLDALKSFGGGQ